MANSRFQQEERAIIRTTNLVKAFRTRKRLGALRSTWEETVAVNGLNLEIPAGRITGLLGVNGAGKTTVIKMLATLLLPTSGCGEIDGLDLVRDADRIRPMINLIAGGERALYWRLTGRENLWYYGQLYNIPRSDLTRRIASLLDLVGLDAASDKPVEQYSKGMKQRLQIARGLINEPRYIFMDEPTLGLDAPIARQLRRMTRELAQERGRGILLTSHYMQEVEELCDYIYIIDAGRMVMEGTAAEIKARSHGDRRTRVTVAGDFGGDALAALRAGLPGMDVSSETGEEGTQVTVRGRSDATARTVELLAGLGLRILRTESLEPTLEDAIVSLAERREAVS